MLRVSTADTFMIACGVAGTLRASTMAAAEWARRRPQRCTIAFIDDAEVQ
jgi:hypothetical protein